MTYQDPNLRPNDPARRPDIDDVARRSDVNNPPEAPGVARRSYAGGTIGLLAGVVVIILILAFLFGYSGQNSQTAGVNMPPTTSAPAVPSQASRPSTTTPPSTTGQAPSNTPAPSTPATPPASPSGNAK